MKDFILASSSPQRIRLLKQMGYEPKKIEPADIDETPYGDETPEVYVKRMALEKALAVSQNNPGENVLAADSIVVVDDRIIQKSQTDAEQTALMRDLSGTTHRVMTAVCVISKNGIFGQELNINQITVKSLSDTEIADYVAGGEWRGAAGYKIEGMMEAFTEKINGSFSGIVGLPLCLAKEMLNKIGI